MSKPSINNFSILDWDFSLVPDSEIHACFRYEYAREILDYLAYFEQDQKQIDARNKWRRKHANFEFDPEDDLSFLEVMVRERDVLEPYTIPYEFPECPWQRIPEFLRARIVKKHVSRTSGVYPTWDASAITPRQQAQLAAAFGKEIVRLTISWRHSDAALIDDFRNWLAHHRPSDIPVMVDRSLQSMRDDLSALGALRLRHQYTTSEAISLSREFVGAPLYSRPFSWDRATARAINKFGEMFPGVEGPRSSKPRPNPRGRPSKQQTTSFDSAEEIFVGTLAQIDNLNAREEERSAKDRSVQKQKVVEAVRAELSKPDRK